MTAILPRRIRRRRAPGFSGPKGARVFEVAGLRGVALTGKGADVAAACATGAVVIVAAVVEAAPKAVC